VRAYEEMMMESVVMVQAPDEVATSDAEQRKWIKRPALLGRCRTSVLALSDSEIPRGLA
jgi:hypothetical protein